MNAIKKKLVTIFLLTLSLTAQAELVFTDDFNRSKSKTVGNDWLEIERNKNDVKITKKEEVLLRDRVKGSNGIDSAIVHKVEFPASELTLSFDWKPLLASDQADSLKVSWSTTGDTTQLDDWQTLFTASLGSNNKQWNTNEIIGSDQMIGLQGQDSFYLMFWVDLGPQKKGRAKEGVRLDNIQLSNTAAIITPVPLPSTILFFVTGLAGLLLPRKLKST